MCHTCKYYCTTLCVFLQRGETALHFAANYWHGGSFATVKLLVDAGAKVDVADKVGRCFTFSLQLICFWYNSVSYVCHQYGCTPLHVAVAFCRFEAERRQVLSPAALKTVSLLVKHGADAHKKVNCNYIVCLLRCNSCVVIIV